MLRKTRAGASRRTLARVALVSLAVLLPACGSDITRSSAAPPSQPRAAIENITPASGEFFRIGDGSTVYMVHNGSYYGIPSWDTFKACAGGDRGGMIHSIASVPALQYAGVIPDVNTHPWIGKSGPVQSSANSTIYAIRGCVKSGFTNWDSFLAAYGPQEPAPVVSAAILDQLPTGAVVNYPLYPVGTLIIKSSGGEIRMVTHGGGALGIPTPEVMYSHCQGVVTEVSDATFQAYASEGVLHASSTGCATPVSSMVVYPELRFPLPTNDYWMLSVEIGTPTSACSGGTGGRYYGGGYDCYHAGTGKYSLDLLPKVRTSAGGWVLKTDVPVIAAAGGTARVTYSSTGYGNSVVVHHKNGFTTRYGHLKSISVPDYANVAAGQTLGIMGTTGNSTGTHLHFEARYNNAGATEWAVLDQLLVGGRKWGEYKVGTSSNPTYFWSRS
jgi:hypothetical protein